MSAPSPTYLYMRSAVLVGDPPACFTLSQRAVGMARQVAPRLSGALADSLQGIHGDGWFGIWFGNSPYAWYQEEGIKPFTMRSLAGKTIPMWVDDLDGSEAAKNPKAKTRIMANGRRQILIFRKAAPIGSRKTVKRKVGDSIIERDVPRSYPGAPGRINRRNPWTVPGKAGNIIQAGQIARGNVGVRWRHPGLPRLGFIASAIEETAILSGITGGPVQIGNE